MMQSVSSCDKRKQMGLARLGILIRILAVAIFSLVLNQLIVKHVILALAHSHGSHRCLHVPPAPEQVHHVLLDGAHFDTSGSDKEEHAESFAVDDEGGQTQLGKQDISDDRLASVGDTSGYNSSSKAKRHILSDSRLKKSLRSTSLISINESWTNSQTKDDLAGGSRQETSRNVLRRLEKPVDLKAGDELVPMQLQVYYDSSVYALEKRKLDIINQTVMPSVVKFFESVLSIKRKYTIEKFRIARRCPNNTIYYARDSHFGTSRPYCMERCEDHAICGEMIVPRDHLSACSYCNRSTRRCMTDNSSEGRGVANTQLLLYVSAKQTARCKRDQTIAYAAHCAQDSKTDRPVAGHANLCPMSISTDPGPDLRALISTVKHELTHVLGFSVSLFAFYRDEHGQPLLEREPVPGPIPVDPKTGYSKWSDKVIKKIVRRGWLTGEGSIDKEVHMIVTPTVVREVRRHFNCSTLEGAELEDQGSDGTSMTHFEKRLFENEAMTGTHTQNSVYSRVTLAVLQDTGWYVANFSRADRLVWGKDLGCDFAKKSCKSWIDERRAKGLSIKPYCDRVKNDVLQIACTEDRSSKAVCNLRRFKERLPSVYQHFDELDGISGEPSEQHPAYYGGSVDLADYCPFIQEFTWQAQNVSVRGSRCDLGSNTIEPERNAALEHYSPESRCFEHGRQWEQRTCQYKRRWHHYGAGCYKYLCHNDHINVIVGNHSYPCFYPDQLVHVEQLVDNWLYNGTLLCPSCDKLCPSSKCETYDERVVNLILQRAQSGDLEVGADKLDTLRTIFDEVYNMIDSNGRAETTPIDFKSLTKYELLLDEVSKLNDARKLTDQPSLLAKLRQSVPYIFTSPIARPPHSAQQSPRHLLSCSSGSSSRWSMGDAKYVQIILVILVSLHLIRMLIRQ